MHKYLDSKVILITGSSSGIGKACAHAAIEAGAQVMLTGTNECALARLAKSFGDTAYWKAGNLASDADCSQIFDATIEHFGKIDGLVNNAGIFPRSDIDTDVVGQFDSVFHVNSRAPLLLSQRLIHWCREHDEPGTIVNIGSINAYCGADMILIYSMSKGALMTMTRNLADAHARDGIRINQLNVGWVLTEGEQAIQAAAGAPDDWHENISPLAAPSGRLLMPEDIAHHVTFWLSDRSGPVSGSVCELEQYPIIGRNAHAG